jgi:hypothetical protein
VIYLSGFKDWIFIVLSAMVGQVSDLEHIEASRFKICL